MAQYFFHLRNGNVLEPDEDGLELPDVDAAYLEAFRAAKDMWIEAIQTMDDNPRDQQFEISDAGGRTLLVLPLREILESLKGGRPPLPMAQAERAAKLSLEVKQAVATARHSLEEATQLLARFAV